MKKNLRIGKDLREVPDWIKKKKCPKKKLYLSKKRICPPAITGKEKLADIIEDTFLAYNSARLGEGCRLYAEKMLAGDVTVGMSLAGALTPAGLGKSCIIPLIKNGFVDWIVATGANLYHDLHFAFNFPPYTGSHLVDDRDLKKNNIVRIYDIFIDYTDCLMSTDNILRDILMQPEFHKEMSTAEFHYLLGKYAAEAEEKTGQKDASMLACAYRAGCPIYTSAPGDSTLGMSISEVEIRGARIRINPSWDVNETTSLVLGAKREGGKSAALLIGGGSPKNFILQTEPQIQETFLLNEAGHAYFFQVTDARPDTGGLSGATPNEAVSWGKVDPDRLPDAVVCYLDATVALPIITHYALARRRKKRLKRLYFKRQKYLQKLMQEYFACHNV
jgi:deoxyhypusine synthase